MSSDSSVLQLSQELIDHILYHIAADSEKWFGADLLQCALVSRSFRPRSQLYIFSSAHIRGDSRARAKKVQDLLGIIQDNPEIGDYVQELTLECTDDEYSWIYEDRMFLDVMKTISSSGRPLRKMTFKEDTAADDGDSLCFQNPEPFLDRFFLPFIAPFITTLSLDRVVNLPIKMVASCVHLRALELLHVEFGDECKNSQSHSLKLVHLVHRLSRAALSKLLGLTSNESIPILDLSQLKSFIVYTDQLLDISEFEQKIIDLSRESLEDLQLITMQTASNVPHGSADLQHTIHLRSLQTHVLFPDDSLVSILQTLSSIRTSSLEDLLIDAKVAFRKPAEPEVIFDANWAGFCTEVLRLMSGVGFRFRFNMTYLYKDNAGMDLNEYEAWLDKRCQSVIERLRNEKLSPLVDDSRLTMILSYTLEFDDFYEMRLIANAYE